MSHPNPEDAEQKIDLQPEGHSYEKEPSPDVEDLPEDVLDPTEASLVNANDQFFKEFNPRKEEGLVKKRFEIA